MDVLTVIIIIVAIRSLLSPGQKQRVLNATNAVVAELIGAEEPKKLPPQPPQ